MSWTDYYVLFLIIIIASLCITICIFIDKFGGFPATTVVLKCYSLTKGQIQNLGGLAIVIY